MLSTPFVLTLQCSYSMAPESSIYSAKITAGALRLRESRLLAGMMLEKGVKLNELVDLALEVNLLQLPNPASTRRVARLLSQRLEILDEDAVQLVREADSDKAIQVLFAASLCHSRILWDFVDLTLRDELRVGANTLPKSVWPVFLEGCEARDNSIASWTDSTREKVRQVCYTILIEAGYLSDFRQLRLMTFRILPGVGEALVGSPAAEALPLMELRP